MITDRRVFVALPIWLLLASGSNAAAQSFPPTEAYQPLFCADGPMVDPFRDQSGAQNERDIIGDAAAPAGLHATDEQFLYLRMRLDDDPAPGGRPRPFAWGFEFDTDGDGSTYEVLIILDGNTSTISLYKNTQTTLPDDPNDPADEPALASYPFASHGRTSVADGSGYGGNADTMLELAVPWSDLALVAIDHTTPLGVWAASSSNSNSLNGDLACHDGAAGALSLSAAIGDRTALDPIVDSDGDGFPDRVEIGAGSDPNDADSVPPPGTPVGPGPISGALIMQGAGGCTVGRAPASSSTALPWLALLALAGAARRRRRC